MTISIQRAKTLCSGSELELVHWSTAKRVEALSEVRLQQKRARARKLRDKYRDLADRQRREARRKQAPRGRRPSEGNDATRAKQQLFQETLERFEAALAKAKTTGAAKKKVSKKTSKKTTKKTTKKTAKKASKKTSKKKVSKKVGAKPASKKTGKKKVSKKQLAKKASRAASSAVTASSSPVPAQSVAAVVAQHKSWVSQSEGSAGKRKAMRFQRTGQPKIQGHVSSQTRRNQAKRDSRG